MEIIKSTAINEGAYGVVYKCQLSDNSIVAIKESFGEKNIDFAGSIRELDMLLKLSDHPNVLKLKQCLFDCNLKHKKKYAKDSIYFIFDYAHCDLYSLIQKKKLDTSKYHQYCSQLLSGLAYIHKNRIIHRDLKPENILYFIEEDAFKICDFGLSKSATYNERNTLSMIVAAYRAPEIYFNYEKYDYKVDVFSMGIILYEMLNLDFFMPDTTTDDEALKSILRRLPEAFTVKDIRKRYTGCGRVKLLPKINLFLSAVPEYDLIKKMIKLFPENRISIFEALDIIGEEDHIQFELSPVNVNIPKRFDRQKLLSLFTNAKQRLRKKKYYSDKMLFSCLDLLSSVSSIDSDVEILFLSCLYLSIKYYCGIDNIPNFSVLIKRLKYKGDVSTVEDVERKILSICQKNKYIFRNTLYDISIEYEDDLTPEQIDHMLSYNIQVDTSDETVRQHYKLFRNSIGFASSE